MKSVYEYETDPSAVGDGRWFVLRIGRDDIGRVRLRPANPTLNSAWRRARSEMYQEVMTTVLEDAKANGDDPTPEQNFEQFFDGKILANAMFETVVVDYELYDRDGETLLPVNRETFVDLMERAPIVLDSILIVAERFANFRLEQEAEAGKDSPTS